jgi:hypothetical protein
MTFFKPTREQEDASIVREVKTYTAIAAAGFDQHVHIPTPRHHLLLRPCLWHPPHANHYPNLPQRRLFDALGDAVEASCKGCTTYKYDDVVVWEGYYLGRCESETITY